MNKDNINPNHYKNSTSLECIEAMLLVFGKNAVVNFCECNAWKYIWRWKHKNGCEDLEKAKWYIKKASELDPTNYSVLLERMMNYIEDNNYQEQDDGGEYREIDKSAARLTNLTVMARLLTIEELSELIKIINKELSKRREIKAESEE